MLAILEDVNAVDEDLLHADGILMWILERRPIRDCRRIEHDDVREVFRLQQPSPIELPP